MNDPTLPPSQDFLRVLRLPGDQHEAMMIRGERPDADQLTGWVYRGGNVPLWARLVGIGKFAKGFYRGTPGTYQLREDGDLYGYNVMVRQNPTEQPWHLKRSPQAPLRHGFYKVSYVDPEARENDYLHALLLDYGRGGNPAIDPSSQIRDYLVRVEPGRDDLLLGKAYVRLGPLKVHTNFFVLERLMRA